MWDWLKGKEGFIPDFGGQSTTDSIKGLTGAGPGEGWMPDESRLGTKNKAAAYGLTGLVGGEMYNSMENGTGAIPDYLTSGVPTKQALGMGGVKNFDMNNPESVMALQERLGVKADGMFGPKTEQAYRAAVDQERQAEGQESLRYDYNEGGPAAKTKLGGWLKNAYSNIDKGVGGILPGGYKKGMSDMTAEERGSY